jgi:hypothetical protein
MTQTPVKPVKTMGRPPGSLEDRWWCYWLYVVEDHPGAWVAGELSLPRTTVVKWALEIHRALIEAGEVTA